MAIQSRVHGGAEAGTFHGLPSKFFTIAATNVGTADTVDSDGLITAEGNFTKTMKAVNSVASVVYIGEREDNGLTIAIDNSYDGNNDPETDAEELKSVIDDATGLSVTVTEKTMAYSEFA